MQATFSTELLDFFLDVEILFENNNPDISNYEYEKIKYSTNQYDLFIFLKYSKSSNKTNTIREISRLLKNIGHPENDEIVNALLILFSLSKKENRDSVLLNKFFSLIKKSRLKQYMFFSGKAEEKIYTLRFKDFQVGAIDYERFASFIRNHSTSDYAEKYKNALQNRVGVEIKNYEVMVLDFFKWALINNQQTQTLTWQESEIINSYLSSISSFYNQNFKRSFYKQQEFINAYFGLYYPLENFEILGHELVNIFYNFLDSPQHGWVLPIHQRADKLFFPDPRILEKVNSFLAKNQDQIYEEKGDFSRFLSTVCSIFSNAEKHINAGNLNHAFVDFFVGLDFLLAPDTEKSKKLKQRVSLLVHSAASLSFTEQLTRLDTLYDVRSLYVHQGRNVTEPDVIEIRNISRIVLSVLLQMHKNSLKKSRISYSE